MTSQEKLKNLFRSKGKLEKESDKLNRLAQETECPHVVYQLSIVRDSPEKYPNIKMKHLLPHEMAQVIELLQSFNSDRMQSIESKILDTENS